jgi:hypothetical protein
MGISNGLTQNISKRDENLNTKNLIHRPEGLNGMSAKLQEPSGRSDESKRRV